MTFTEFKNGVGGSFAARLLRMSLDGISTWAWFQAAALENRKAFYRPGDEDPNLGFYEAMEDRYGTASSGEKGLMMAILHAIDYDALADKLGAEHGRSFLRIIDFADDNYRAAAAACIARLD